MSRIKDISASVLSELIENDHQFEIVDIRTQPEIERGVIPNAKTLPMHLIPINLDFFSRAEHQVVIYCRTGSRSAQVCRFLNKQGIYNVINLRGGIVNWTTSGLPLSTDPDSVIS